MYTPAENTLAVFAALKPDGKVIFNDCLFDSGAIIAELTEQCTAVPGIVHCQLRLYDPDRTLLICPRFDILVQSAVAADEEAAKSENEINALNSLILDANTTVDKIRQSLNNGDFVPQLSVGTVETLPAGSMAQVEISGDPAAPVLNFAIPQGEVGTNEELIPDTQLSDSSTRPVQNRIITAALDEKLSKEEFELSSENFVKNEVFSETVSNLVETGAFDTMMQTKVDKVSGLGLSSNDFTDEEKAKLATVSENANNFTLADSGVTTAKIADYAVTAQKLAADAKSTGLTVTLPGADWADNALTVSAPGVLEDNNIVVSSAPENVEAYLEAGIYCSAQGSGSLTFKCGTAPSADLKANVLILV